MLSDMSQPKSSKAMEIAEEYTSSLRDLTANSKPHINMLTILAEDYIEYASAIVEAVEVHLQKVRSEIKLPVLYLIDSIVKNVNGSYLNHFSKNIVQTFCDVFEKVDDNTREKMWKLRQTWKDIFPVKKLLSLDVRVNSIDPAWPLSNVPSSTVSSKSIIHVNPKFFSVQNSTEQKMREELIRKQQELLDLQKQKLQLEMMQRQHKLERPVIHVKPDLVASDGTLKKPILTTVPSSVPAEKEPETPSVSNDSPSVSTGASTETQQRKPSPTTLVNGVNVTVEEEPCSEPKSDSSLANASPVRSQPTEKAPVVPMSPKDPPPQPEASTSIDSSQPPGNDDKSHDTEPINSQKSSSSNRDSRATSATSAHRESTPPPRTRSSSSSRRSSRKKPWSSKSSSSTSPRKKAKGRKRSRSPKEGHHRHHRAQQQQHHHRLRSPLGLDEEEQLGGSLIVSPPQPKQRRDSAVGAKRRRDSHSSAGSRSRSPEDAPKRRDSRDEDMRQATVTAGATATETKEDLDLRVLPMTSNKRQSTDAHQGSQSKKNKDEFLEDLFGKEDVDLRLLQAAPKPQPAPTTPPTPPPPPVISKDKEGWARFKMPSKSDRSTDAVSSRERVSRDRPGRPKLYNNRPLDTERRRNQGRDYERNSDRNIEIMMKEAAEQLNQGCITKAQYNKLIQEVLHMSEDQKLRAAQRKERESSVWDRGDKGMRGKEHGMHPRPPGGPRWQQPWHQPWAHPPPGPFQGHFRPEFRPMGPWQSHPRLFTGPMRPDFHQFHGGFNPRMGPPPMGPNGPMMMPGPMNPMGGPMGPLPPGIVPLSSIIPRRHSPNTGDNASTDNPAWSGSSHADSGSKADSTEEVSSSSCSDELPQADPKVLEEIAKDTMKSINIDNVPREIRYYGDTGVIFMHWDDPRDIGFQDGARRISIDGKDAVVCSFNDDYREFTYDGEVHRIKLGAPTRELFIDDKWYQCYFGGQPVVVDFGNKKVNVKLEGPPPHVKIGTVKRTDLVVGKINLIINARSMVPVFLDAKPQMFNIDGKTCTLEFIDALQTVLLNDRPFKVEFGGLPKPVIVQGKKHFIRFSVLPRGFRAGYVKILGMRGEQPKELPPSEVGKKVEATSNTSLTTPSTVEPDSTSQDGLDHSYTSKSDLQLDVLSSVIPSAMAPSSGLSYQAESGESTTAPAPTVALPLNLNELFQRLVETGIVSNLNESKKPEEEDKKPVETIPVSFDKPETLKIKQPVMVTALYSGIQCSSCGARFAPEMATRYSHHLDWHFRQNRKERDSSRKAHSRLWYYDVSDWIQFEEIEDLEDRAQSWFETEKQSMETESAAAEELFADTLQPSVPTGTDEDACCQVCHEAFEQFYNDEKEEWHLRPAVTFEDKNFHPLCLEDHKRVIEESAMNSEISEKIEDCKDKVAEDLKLESTESVDVKTEDNENVEVSIKTEESEPMNESVDPETSAEDKTDNITSSLSSEETEENVTEEKMEVEMPTNDNEVNNETEVDKPEETNETDKDEEKVNSEPTESTEITETTETIETIETTEASKDDISDEIKEDEDQTELMETELSLEEAVVAETSAVDSTQVEVKSTIDGNVELESAALIVPTAQSKIKINITKSINSPKESKEIKENKEELNETTDEKEIFVPLQPASIKPALRDRNLSVLPPVEKGEELSALCSIM